MSKADFLSKAYAAARQSGLNPTQAALAATQAAHETGYGVHAPRNNMFGIKATKSWKGATQRLATHEQINGKLKSRMATFRAYPSMAAAFKDWAKVVEKNWPAAMKAATFAEAVAALNAGLPGGYATASNYAIGVNAAKSIMDKNNVQAAYERPDNFAASGPKGLFSVDTGVASPIGHVSRSPLGPVSPSQPAFSGLGTPRGVNTVAGMSTPGSFTSQDEKGNTGSYKNAPNAGNFVSQDERASFVDRMGIPGAVAPSASPPSPTRPDNFAYSGPKGVFSVDPAASVKVDIARPAIAPAPAAPVVGLPSIPAAVPTRPAIAPVPAAAVPAPAVKVAAVAPSASGPALAPARPALSPADVYGGAIGTAQTSTPGTTVSRSTSYGPTYTTNQYGAVTATAPDGTQMAAWGGVPSAKPAISGPLSNTGIATPPSTGVSGMFGPKAKAATGTIAGAAIGGYALGPLGAMLGGLIGKNIAAGKAPLSGIFGGNNANTHVVDTFDGPMSFANAKGGLGFPSAPANPGGYTATSSNNSAAGMRGISPGAAAAIGAGQGGLY